MATLEMGIAKGLGKGSNNKKKKYPKLQLLFIPKSLRQHHYLLCRYTLSSLPPSPGHPPLTRPVPVPVSSGLFLQGSLQHVGVLCESVCAWCVYVPGNSLTRPHQSFAAIFPAHSTNPRTILTLLRGVCDCMCVCGRVSEATLLCVFMYACFSFTKSFLRHQLKTLKLIDRRDREPCKLVRSRC